MSLTELLDTRIDTASTDTSAPHASDADTATADEATAVVRSGRVFDLSGGRCAVEVVFAPFGIVAWRVRLQPASIRIVEDAIGGAEITAHVSARPKYASIPGTTGLFMPATERSTILAATAAVPRLEVGANVTAVGVVNRGPDEWPLELVLNVRELDDEHVVAVVRGVILRRDDLPLPGVRLGIDIALDLRRCA